ncbi:MAG: hypothetical protein HY360_16705 [Verrucomicrobia bacterium]|nr:hypothetical protein [Verrucomicrobiota bacterium]
MKALSISEAKRDLGRVADQALQGEPVFIMRKARILTLREYHLPEPLPVRPSGYFADCHVPDEIKESNRLASLGPRKVVS